MKKQRLQRSVKWAVLVVALLLASTSVAQADNESKPPREGYQWSMSGDGTLRIESNAGWRHYQKHAPAREPIRLVIGPDVTSMPFVEAPAYLSEYWEETIEGGFPICPEEIVVETGNTAFVLENGLLIQRRTHTVVLSEKGVVEAIIPEGVAEIGVWAFYARDIRSVRFPKTLKRIHTRAFGGCDALTRLQFPDSLESIGDFAFHSCKGLTAAVFPQSLKRIGDYAFAHCERLADMELPRSLRTLGTEAFSNCAIREVFLPRTLTELSANMFLACERLEWIVWEDGVESIGGFQDCTALKEITLPESAKRIEWAAFAGCGALESVTFPDALTVIGSYAFKNCHALRRVALPQRLSVLGKGAFDCAGLTEINLPDGLRELHAWSLHGNDYAYLELPARCRIELDSPTTGYTADKIETTWPTGTFCGYLQTLVIRAQKPIIPTEALQSCYALTHLIFFGLPPTEFDGPPVAGCTVYCTERYAKQWSPDGANTWRGYPLEILPEAELEALCIQLKQEAKGK